MKPAPSAVKALIDASRLYGTNFVYADCYTVTLLSGSSFYYTAGQQDIHTNSLMDDSSVTFLSGKLLFTGLKSKLSVGVNVDEQDLVIAAKPTDTVLGVPFLQACILGLLDGAIVRRDRYFAQDWFSPIAGGIPMFLGRVSTMNAVGRQEAAMKIKSYMVLFDINMPRELMQPSCLNTLYDGRCKANPALFNATGTVGVGPSGFVIPWSGATSSFSRGYIEMNTGTLSGQRRNIAQGTGSALVLNFPFDPVPAAGDQFTAFFGCDKTLTTCINTFNNKTNFRGYPFVPPPEMAV